MSYCHFKECIMIEIIEFYPLEINEEKVTGTLRISLPDIGIHILGIYVSKFKDRYSFSLPGRNGIHHETGENVRYPYIVFEDRAKQKELIAQIREKGRDFIEKRLADKENPLIFPQKRQQQPKQAESPMICNDAPEIKETMPIAKPETNQSNAVKNWVTPPPIKARKSTAFKKNNYSKR